MGQYFPQLIKKKTQIKDKEKSMALFSTTILNSRTLISHVTNKKRGGDMGLTEDVDEGAS